ncbi:glycosyltransferase family 39 protein [Streptomyces subrutilus]|uniref:Glycosyltransferase RgtA/B/C/D-like domain-containing protein n=1 Tax=Streptomyces subrutilus TaxID=36818 RepID=A0A1E5PLC4_9ACTN|nr:glycosyltransferase family 39 protein [Streptomyces subrutilus]OEJ30366.1 hypothetical protein BGK67_02465 [Streptomyces subrutilus]
MIDECDSRGAIGPAAARPRGLPVSPDPGAGRVRGSARFDPLGAALLTFAVACAGSGTVQLWRDELASWSAALRSPDELLAMLGNVDAGSGAYYLLLHGWVSLFGDSPAMLRMPSALAMGGAAAFVVLTARTLFDRRAALFAGVLFAAIPAVSRFGQEARAYAFVTLAVAAATWFLVRALHRPTALRWLPYGVAVTCAGLFHIVSLIVLLPHALIVLGRWWDARSWRLPTGYALAVLASLLPLLPLMVVARGQVGRQIGWLHPPHFRDLAGLWSTLSLSVPVSYALLAAAALPLAWPRGRRPAAELALVAALPVPAAWLISQTGPSYFLDRYLLFTLPAWAVLAAAGLGALRPRPLGVVGLVLLMALGVGDQRRLRTEHAKGPGDGKRAAAFIAAGYEPGDGLAPVGGRSERLFMFGPMVEYYLPEHVKPRDVFAERSAVAAHDLFPTECGRPARCLDGVRRVWVVTWSGTSNPYHGFPPDQEKALRDHYEVVGTTTAGTLQVTLVERTR